MKGIWNLTTGKWVVDADSDEIDNRFRCDDPRKLAEALEQVRDLDEMGAAIHHRERHRFEAREIE
jgi:hypothetical protein